VLIVLPPSEAKRPTPDAGAPVDVERLSFRELNPTRELVAHALIATSTESDALDRLRVGPTLGHEVVRNIDLFTEPSRPAIEVYSGPLYDGLDVESMDARTRRRTDANVVIASALWGLLRPSDRIPAYRLHVCANLVGVERIDATWREVLPAALAEAAGERGVILDLRSPMYQATGKAAGMSERTIIVRVGPAASHGGVGDVVAKRVRGQAARYLLESGADPDDPELLAVILEEHWPVRLEEPPRPGQPWSLQIRPLD